jgi:hypothetical protein
MTDKELKTAYMLEDSRRLLTEPMFELDIVRLRRAIQGILPGNIIKMKCYNKPEMEMIRDQLTPEERKLVIFTWIDWPQENHAD